MHAEDDTGERPDRAERKGARRRAAAAMDRLADALVALPRERLAQIPLPDEIAEAIGLAQRISAHGGRRRQLQLIGKLMRHADAEPIQAALDRLRLEDMFGTAAQHRTEHWRDRLIAEGDVAIAEFVDAHPAADPQQLRQLVRAAQQEQTAGRPPKSARELFRRLREAAEG